MSATGSKSSARARRRLHRNDVGSEVQERSTRANNATLSTHVLHPRVTMRHNLSKRRKHPPELRHHNILGELRAFNVQVEAPLHGVGRVAYPAMTVAA